MRRFIIAFMALAALALAGCMPTYQGHGYAHKPTHKFTASMVNWDYDEASKFVDRADQRLLIAPRFREFSKDFGTYTYAYIYFVSPVEGDKIHLKSVSLSAPDREPMTQIIDTLHTLEYHKPTSPIMNDEDMERLKQPFEQVRIFFSRDGYDASLWNEEPRLTLTVSYTLNDGAVETESFIIEAYTYTGIAWPT